MKTYRISRRCLKDGKVLCVQLISSRSIELAKIAFASKCGCTIRTLERTSDLFVESVK